MDVAGHLSTWDRQREYQRRGGSYGVLTRPLWQAGCGRASSLFISTHPVQRSQAVCSHAADQEVSRSELRVRPQSH